MPFENPFPRSFNSMGVRSYAPATSGVYGISNASGWIYIGETNNIRESLLADLLGDSPLIMSQRPTGYVFEICPAALRLGRQDRLVFEYDPSLNRMRQ